MTPTQRSVVARQPSNTFDGGWRDDTFLRAAMIRTFCRNAVADRRIFNADRNVCRWLLKPGTQNKSWIDARFLSLFLSLVKFPLILGLKYKISISYILQCSFVDFLKTSYQNPQWIRSLHVLGCLFCWLENNTVLVRLTPSYLHSTSFKHCTVLSASFTCPLGTDKTYNLSLLVIRFKVALVIRLQYSVH